MKIFLVASCPQTFSLKRIYNRSQLKVFFQKKRNLKHWLWHSKKFVLDTNHFEKRQKHWKHVGYLSYLMTSFFTRGNWNKNTKISSQKYRHMKILKKIRKTHRFPGSQFTHLYQYLFTEWKRYTQLCRWIYKSTSNYTHPHTQVDDYNISTRSGHRQFQDQRNYWKTFSN